MNLKETLEAAAIVVSQKAKENPAGGLKKGNTKILYSELKNGLEQISGWCFKEDVNVSKVVYCKNCINYKMYQKKNDRKAARVYLCSLDKKKKPENHYCGYGEENI